MTPRLIPAGNPGAFTGRGNNTYLIGTVLIDAGVGQSAHLDALAAALGDQPLEHIVITHGHSDHVSGVPSLCERWPAARVHNLVRGVAPPYPGAFSSFEGLELRVLRTRLAPGAAQLAAPALYAEDGSCFAVCGDGARLQILEMELDGQPLSAADFAARFGKQHLLL